ncbi:hypothetical protein BTVI_25264 [Pitangus sulphuratus]|nr:hypothetical protein BTVI_25264 [Pitangus sulphuratus]
MSGEEEKEEEDAGGRRSCALPRPQPGRYLARAPVERCEGLWSGRVLPVRSAQYVKAREDRKAQINASYKYIFEVLSARIGLDSATVEEMILDAPSLEAFDSFFAKRGRKALKIFYQEGDAPGIECGRMIPGAAKGSKMMQFYVDKPPDKIIGLCLFFVRCKNDSAINEKTIHEEIYFGVFDATEGLLRGVKNMVEKVFLPAILTTSNWGTLGETKEDTKDKQNFLETINRYLSFLEGTAASIEGTVELQKIDYINFSELRSFEKVAAAADNYDTVHQLEEVLMIWYKQIEHVLIESKQIRREANDSGPLTELEHWKYTSAKLNFIIEQIKGQNCKAVINVLRVGHSKLLRTWQELDARITDAANESKDNVKYLYTIENVCRPLYVTDVDCMCLLKEYQKCFREAKQEILETLGEKAFEVSEMYIFGKSEAFCRRLEKITEMIAIEKNFSALSLCAIEGIDLMAVKFKNIFHIFQKKQYDVLDPQNTEFDVDFDKFLTEVERLELYQSQKDDPPLARNMPPIAGKILWVRQLFRRINEPINYFHKNSNILASPEGKAVVQSYNKLAYVLVEFEVVYHNAWMKEMSQLEYPLQATIFVRHPKSEKFLVNFDPQILEIVRETKCMIKLGLEVPEQAVKIVIIENKLKANKLRLEGLVQCYEDLCRETPNIFVNLLTTKMQKVSVLSEVRIGSILKEISDTALVILPADGPIKVEDMLTCNEAYTKECAALLNTKSMHIEDAVQELIALFEKNYELPSSKTSEEGEGTACFKIKHNVQLTKLLFFSFTVKEKRIAFENNEKEKEKNTPEAPPSEDSKVDEKEEEFKKSCKDLLAYFTRRLLFSLQKATRLSLASIKKRISVSDKPEEVTPFLKAEVHLAIPNLEIVPSLDDIQQAINRMIHLILEVNRGVAQWGQRHLQKSILKPQPGTQQASSGKRAKKGEKGTEDALIRKLKNFYAGVTEHEAITKLVVLLSSSMNPIKEIAIEVLQYFEKYKILWTEDKDAKIQAIRNNAGLT